MARTPKTDPNIYQVDLVAGLFGAFMLVWISGAQETEFPGEEAEPPIFATIEMEVTLKVGGNVSSFSIVPEEAVEGSCLSRNYLDKVGLIGAGDYSECAATQPAEEVGYTSAIELAFDFGVGCVSAVDDPPHPWYYSSSLVGGRLTNPALNFRGIVASSRAMADHSPIPFVDTHPYDSKMEAIKYIEEWNQDTRDWGWDEYIVCRPQRSNQDLTVIYSVAPAAKLWSSSSFEFFLDATPTRFVAYSDNGGSSPSLWATPGEPFPAFVPEHWDQGTVVVTLCAYRDGDKQCFQSGAEPVTKQGAITLARLSDA